MGDRNVIDELLNRKVVENEVIPYQCIEVASKKKKKKKKPWWSRPSTYIGLTSAIFFCIIVMFVLVYLGKAKAIPFSLSCHIIFGLFILELLGGWLLLIAIALDTYYS